MLYTRHKQQNHRFFPNSFAVMGYPVYLTVAIIVTAAVLAVFVQSAVFISESTDDHMIAQELHKIVTEAQNMYEYADEGTLVTVQLKLPDSLHFAVFGDMPKPGYGLPSDLIRSHENLSNHYYYVLNNGEMSMFHIPARFCGEDVNDIVLLRPGTLDLVLELKKYGERSYVQITSQ